MSMSESSRKKELSKQCLLALPIMESGHRTFTVTWLPAKSAKVGSVHHLYNKDFEVVEVWSKKAIKI